MDNFSVNVQQEVGFWCHAAQYACNNRHPAKMQQTSMHEHNWLLLQVTCSQLLLTHVACVWTDANAKPQRRLLAHCKFLMTLLCGCGDTVLACLPTVSLAQVFS